MMLAPNVVQRIAIVNPDRVYFYVQNISTTSSDLVYLMQSEEEPETFKNNGIVIGGLGVFEMQNCLNFQSKKAWYAYTEVSGLDVRVMDI